MYLEGVIPWHSSKWVAPPPEEISRIRKEAGTHDGPMAADDEITVGGDQGGPRGSTMTDATDVEKEGEMQPKEPENQE